MTTGEDAHGCDYFTQVFLSPELCNSTDGNVVITYTDGKTEILETDNKKDNNPLSSLSSDGLSPLLLVIPAIIAAIAALNIPTIQAALASIAGGLF